MKSNYKPFDIETYEKERNAVKQHFDTQKTGEQATYANNARLFQPVIEANRENSKQLEASQQSMSNTYLSLLNELQRQNDHAESFQSLPFHGEPQGIEYLSHSTPKKDSGIVIVDLDGELLNQTHTRNLEDMGLPLPSKVNNEKLIEQTIDKIKTENKSIGQYLSVSSKKSFTEKKVFSSRKETLKLYREKIHALQGSQQFITKKTGQGVKRRQLVKLKRGRGRPKQYPDPIMYNTPADLANKLSEHVAAKTAGHTGLDNIITSMMDELLKIGIMSKDEYDKLYKIVFPIYIK